MAIPTPELIEALQQSAAKDRLAEAQREAIGQPAPVGDDSTAGLGGPTFNPDTHFAQPKITGYRQLSTNEVKLMNAIKAQGEMLQALVDTLRGTPGLDQRWISIGVTDLQQGLMALTRGVARPTSF